MDYTYNLDDAAMIANATTIHNGMRVRLTNDGQFIANRLLLNGDVFTVSEAIDEVAERRPDLLIPVVRR